MRVGIVILFLAGAGCSHRLPPAPEHVNVGPKLEAIPDGVQACWVEYGRAEGPGFPITAGPTDLKHFHGTASGILVRHPKGDVLIDAGNSLEIKQEIHAMKWYRRIYAGQGAGKIHQTAPPADLLAALGVDPAKLAWFIPTHAHLDHIGGLRDLPQSFPVLMAPAEIDLCRTHAHGEAFGVIPEQCAAALADDRVHAIDWSEGGPYENFDQSFDVFGDGTIVLVDLHGHTPGSVGVFVNLSPAKRMIDVGDAVFAREGIEHRQPKGLLIRSLDRDRAQANRMVSKLAQLHAQDPGLLMIPAHERDAWAAVFGKPGACVTK